MSSEHCQQTRYLGKQNDKLKMSNGDDVMVLDLDKVGQTALHHLTAMQNTSFQIVCGPTALLSLITSTECSALMKWRLLQSLVI